jgi:hypothetical protein
MQLSLAGLPQRPIVQAPLVKAPAQAVGTRSAQHDPVQQAPARGHGFGLHVRTPNVKTDGEGHPAPATMLHTPSTAQQEPTFAHGLMVQVVPNPLKAEGEVQPAPVVMVQAPRVLQHAPRTAGHGLGVQVRAPIVNVAVPVQPGAATIVHIVVVQQEPTAKQGLGSHTVPGPLKVFPEPHAPAV